MSRRTETAYKARFAGKLAPHNEALDSADMVNAAVVWQKFTFLSGEICPALRSPLVGAPPAVMHGVIGQKSADGVVVDSFDEAKA